MAVNPRPDFERYCQNMSNPKVSVLVPVYNGEKYLRECLDSILAQDYASVEILVADDGSNDGSAALLADYAVRDPRIRWWKTGTACCKKLVVNISNLFFRMINYFQLWR